MKLLQALRLKPYSAIREKTYIPATQLHKKLAKGQFEDIDATLSRASDQSRERLLYEMATYDGSLELAKAWSSSNPTSAFARLFCGICLVVKGWNIRGCSYAEEVPDDAWGDFFALLEQADAKFKGSLILDTKLPDPYSWMILTSIAGPNSSVSLQYKWFIEATNIDPLHWPAHSKYFLSLTQKWGGSHKEMFSFARKVTEYSPPKSINHVLVADAYLEYYLAQCSDSDDRLNIALGLKNPKYAGEIIEALYKWLDATSENLENQLIAINGPFASHALNSFAAALFLCGAKKETNILLTALNNEIELLPWAWLALNEKERNNAAFVYDRACREMKVSF